MQILAFKDVAPLGNAGVYTSQVMSMAKVDDGLVNGVLKVQILTDQASAANGAKLQASVDNITYFTVTQAATVANTLLSLTADICFPYYRLQLTNGATPQTSLSIAGNMS